MKKTDEIQFITNIIEMLGNPERIKLLQKSNLTVREQKILATRYIEGMSIKEASEHLNMVEITYIKNQQRALKKLYYWVQNKDAVKQIYNLMMNLV